VFTARYALSPYIKQIRFVFKGLININKHYSTICCFVKKNILPEDGRIVAAETCRRVYKFNCAVVGFINKFA
jgi:hypothetical protein